MNYTLIFNHLLESICVNLLNYLELCPDFLPSLLYKKNLVEADINVPKVRSGRVQLAVSLIPLLMASLVAFFYKTSLALLLLERKGADL